MCVVCVCVSAESTYYDYYILSHISPCLDVAVSDSIGRGDLTPSSPIVTCLLKYVWSMWEDPVEVLPPTIIPTILLVFCFRFFFFFVVCSVCNNLKECMYTH